MVIEFRAKNKLLLPALAKASLSAILITGPAGNDDSSSNGARRATFYAGSF